MDIGYWILDGSSVLDTYWLSLGVVPVSISRSFMSHDGLSGYTEDHGYCFSSGHDLVVFTLGMVAHEGTADANGYNT